MHALAVSHALFRAQFARELWIEPDDLDDRLATVATRLFGVLRRARTGQPRRPRHGPGELTGVA